MQVERGGFSAPTTGTGAVEGGRSEAEAERGRRESAQSTIESGEDEVERERSQGWVLRGLPAADG